MNNWKLNEHAKDVWGFCGVRHAGANARPNVLPTRMTLAAIEDTLATAAIRTTNEHKPAGNESRLKTTQKIFSIVTYPQMFHASEWVLAWPRRALTVWRCWRGLCWWQRYITTRSRMNVYCTHWMNYAMQMGCKPASLSINSCTPTGGMCIMHKN